MREKPLILVVDDESDLREVISLKLKAAGYDIDTAKNEEEGVKKAKELMPDLVLMDVRMPPKPTAGIDAALTLKGMPETKALKIAFLSNMENPWPAMTGERADVSREFGMEDFIPKMDLEKLVDRVKVILSRS